MEVFWIIFTGSGNQIDPASMNISTSRLVGQNKLAQTYGKLFLQKKHLIIVLKTEHMP